MSRTTIALAAATAAAALALPAAAQAHVTVNPREGTAGAFTKLDIRVPNERANASTVKVQLPDGFAFASYEPRADWRVRVTRGRLATPVQSEDGEITEGVKRITWTGDGTGLGRIAPGQFFEFPISVQIPESAAGKTLTFKAIQTYSNGEIVRWIGAPDSESPAPTLTVAAAAAASGGGHGAAAPAAATTPASGGGNGDGTLGVIALIVGGVGLVAASVAIVVTRRPHRRGKAGKTTTASRIRVR
jgi:periplasmic copper chaperone A